MIESEILKQIIKLLLLHGFIVIRVNSGRRGKVKFYTIENLKKSSGLSDILAVSRDITIFFEVKTEKGKQSEAQKEFQKLCDVKKVRYVVLRSIEDGEKFLHQLKIELDK